MIDTRLRTGKRERYVLAAFSIDEERSVKYSTYYTINGLKKGVGHAIEDKKADYISLRIIRPMEKRK